jgi:hypothetical protein
VNGYIEHCVSPEYLVQLPGRDLPHLFGAHDTIFLEKSVGNGDRDDIVTALGQRKRQNRK